MGKHRPKLLVRAIKTLKLELRLGKIVLDIRVIKDNREDNALSLLIRVILFSEFCQRMEEN